MSKFIYVFTEEAKNDMEKRGYQLLKKDEANNIWVFVNNNPDSLEFSSDYQCVLSNMLTF